MKKKLSETLLSRIWKLYKFDNESIRSVSKITGVPRSTIGDFVCGNTYKDFSRVEDFDKDDLSRNEAHRLLNEAILEEIEISSELEVPEFDIKWNKRAHITSTDLKETYGSRIWQPLDVSEEKKDKKMVVLSDIHAGHQASITPPEFWVNEASNKEFYAIQREAWEWYSDKIKSIGKVDVLVVNGDGVEGKGTRSGCTEVITTDMIKQSDIAIRCIEECSFDKMFMTFGTASHTSESGEDYEELIARNFKCIIKDHLFLDVNGCIFDIKHDVGGSSILSGRATAVIKAYEWACKQADDGTAPRPDVVIRSHVHFHMTATDNNNFIAMTTPALQSSASKYGRRKCQGITNFGFVEFDIPDNYSDVTDISYKVHLKNLESNISRLEKV